MWTWRDDGRPGADRTDEWLRQAQLCEDQHRLQPAIRAYEHVARSPDQDRAAFACYHLGMLYEERHKVSSAIRAYRQAAGSPDRDMATSAYYHLGRIYEHRHRRSSAIGAYDRAVRLGGADSDRARHALERLST
jgi:tetratricopeptide (TPR) repeat protein